MARELKPCGTPAAYSRHRSHGEEACRACKDAVAANRRANDRGRAYARARIRALGRLSRAYSTAYQALLAEEMAKEENR